MPVSGPRKLPAPSGLALAKAAGSIRFRSVVFRGHSPHATFCKLFRLAQKTLGNPPSSPGIRKLALQEEVNLFCRALQPQYALKGGSRRPRRPQKVKPSMPQRPCRVPKDLRPTWKDPKWSSRFVWSLRSPGGAKAVRDLRLALSARQPWGLFFGSPRPHFWEGPVFSLGFRV